MKLVINLFPVIAFGALFLYVGFTLWRHRAAELAEQARTSAGERLATTVGVICIALAALTGSMATPYSALGMGLIVLFALG